MFIYIAFYEAMDKNGKVLFKGHVTMNVTQPVSDGANFMVSAETEAFSQANGFDTAAVEVVIVGITKL